MLQYWIWFAEQKELGGIQKRLLLEHFSDAEDIYRASGEMLLQVEGLEQESIAVLADKDLSNAQMIIDQCRQKEIQILTYGDDRYPKRLRNIDQPPAVLYYKGILPDFEATAVVAIVGTRKATGYGLTTARRMSRQIAQCGAMVLSGGAFGIDAMAMQGAMDAGCPTVGVLGCGLDVVYPKSNTRLFEAVLEKGCLLSEYPPGTPPLKWNFPKRNRIMSGIADGVLVIEAPKISGALSTARWALRQGRDVFVVPGNVDMESCEGSNALLQEGVFAACSGLDVIKEYTALYPDKLTLQPAGKAEPVHREERIDLKVAQKAPKLQKGKETIQNADKKSIDKEAFSPYSGIKEISPDLNEEERALVACLNTQPRPVDELIAETGKPAAKVLGMLTMLSLRGVVENHPGKRVSLKGKKPGK